MNNDNQKLYAVAGVFDNPDKIISAVKKIANAGYTQFDVNSSYPLHGMEKAMKLKPSRLGLVTLVFGLLGTTTALLLTWWTLSIDYPMIIGGKPFFALPAFIPVTFELTVLFATLATVIGMLAFFFKLPANSHPLMDTQYMKDVSEDKFGVYVKATDGKLVIPELENLLKNEGAIRVDEIYLPAKEIYPILQPRFISFLAVVFVVTSIIVYVTLNKLIYIDPFNWMSNQQKQVPQRASVFFEDEFGMRTPVKGTVARGYMPYESMGLASPKDSLMPNPIPSTADVIEKGHKKFLTYCSPCHGNFADGDSRLHGQFVNPPSLHTNRARNFSDAMIYHIITNGQNSMPSYAAQITREERWSIVHYLRTLQRAKNASVDDISKVNTGAK